MLPLQDYFVLVPNEYYEPSLLREDVFQPCMAGSRQSEPYCKHYAYPDVSEFPIGWADYAERPGGGGGNPR